MKTRTTIALLAVALSIPLTAVAQASDNDGCTNATLNGDYAFRVSGQILPSGAAPIARDGVAMMQFDGQGGFTQVDFMMSNGVPLAGPADPTTRFHTGETGWYRVSADCTGSAEIRFPAPPGLSSGAVLDLKFVLADHGRSIHTIVSRLVPPGSTMPVPASIHSDGEKLGWPITPRG